MATRTLERAGRILRYAACAIGLFAFAAILASPVPDGLAPGAWRALAVAALMGAFWIGEVLPIPLTALLPILLFPLLGVMPSDAVAREYAGDLIFLFFGGFFLARTLERWGAHRRLALHVLAAFGTRPARLILGAMVAVAFLSMWMSNTATALMMLPIALALADQLAPHAPDESTASRFNVAFLLGIAYAANVGGMGTPIGSPTNAIFLRYFEGAACPSFAQWLLFAVPLCAVFLVTAWFVLTRVLFRFPSDLRLGDDGFVRRELDALGPPSPEEKATALVFLVTVLLWMTRRDLVIGSLSIPGWVTALRSLGADWLASSARTGVGDSAVSILAVVSLCVLRARRGGPRLASWGVAEQVPWGMLLLLGGGFALAKGFATPEGGQLHNLSTWIGASLARFESAGALVLLPMTALSISFLTEFASNTATSSLTVPILALVGDPTTGRLLSLTAVLSASCAFMLPVATPPNAIVYASGRIRIGQMVRAGILLNLIGAVLTSGAVWLIARHVLPG